jgi:hypothetical protein
MKNDRQWLQVDKIFQSSIQYGHTQRAKHWVENPFRGNADEVVFKGWQKIKRETTKIKRNLSKKSNEANIGLWLVIEFLPVLWWWQRTTWKREDQPACTGQETRPPKLFGRSPRRAGADASNSDNSSIHCDDRRWGRLWPARYAATLTVSVQPDCSAWSAAPNNQ